MWFLLLACGSPEVAPAELLVVVAARDLSVGVPIGEQDVYGLRMEARFAPPDALTDPTDVLGRVPSSRILANEPIRAARLADATLQRQLAAMVPPELTVVTVPLDPTVSLAPTPGRDKVDVWRDADPRTGKGERVASALPILRIDDAMVAVMANDGQVEQIEAARRVGGKLTVLPVQSMPAEPVPAVSP